MSNPRSRSGHPPLVQCLLDIERRHDAGGWNTSNFNVVYTLHRGQQGPVQACPIPMDQAARSGTLGDVLELLIEVFREPLMAAVLTAGATSPIVGLAACAEAWMVTRDRVGEPGMRLAQDLADDRRLSLHPGRVEIRFAQGLLVDGTQSMVQRTRGQAPELVAPEFGGRIRDALSGLLAVAVRPT